MGAREGSIVSGTMAQEARSDDSHKNVTNIACDIKMVKIHQNGFNVTLSSMIEVDEEAVETS